jgi:uncharacterized glyoxalase superfamily protein PhnB
MRTNRSMPQSHVIPVLQYPDVGEAIDWLCDTFGFTIRWRVGNHRAQLNVGQGAIALTENRPRKGGGSSRNAEDRHSIMVRIEDVERHYNRSMRGGARILEAPTDYPYGERQYTVEDLGGHTWTFSESTADVAPEDWGGTSGET